MCKFSNKRQRKATQTVRRIRYTRLITQLHHKVYKAGHSVPCMEATLTNVKAAAKFVRLIQVRIKVKTEVRALIL